jgi:hypothetical protein
VAAVEMTSRRHSKAEGGAGCSEGSRGGGSGAGCKQIEERGRVVGVRGACRPGEWCGSGWSSI